MRYHVVLATELGRRSGMLTLEREQDRLDGRLTLLGVETAVTGTVNADGACELNGCLLTPLGRRSFSACGAYQEEDGLCLTVHEGERIYSLCGTVVREK